MRKDQQAICYYPTSIIIVDDRESYLDSLKLRLIHRPISSFTNPVAALAHINKTHIKNFIDRCLTENDTVADSILSDMRISDIHKEIFNPRRFEKISIVIVDYAMPEMNGLELCQQIKDKQIKKIMLTGEADHDLAVEAFNAGLIDKFIKKSDPDLTQKIKQSVTELEQDYFQELSQFVFKHPDYQLQQLHRCLSDKTVVKCFSDLLARHNICEYYLLDKQGGFILLDENGDTSFLIIANEEMMKAYSEIAELADIVNEEVIMQLKNRGVVPFFYSEDDFDTLPHQWQNFLYPAEKLSGNEVYYFAVIDEPRQEVRFDNEILEYVKFLNKT